MHTRLTVVKRAVAAGGSFGDVEMRTNGGNNDVIKEPCYQQLQPLRAGGMRLRSRGAAEPMAVSGAQTSGSPRRSHALEPRL